MAMSTGTKLVLAGAAAVGVGLFLRKRATAAAVSSVAGLGGVAAEAEAQLPPEEVAGLRQAALDFVAEHKNVTVGDLAGYLQKLRSDVVPIVLEEWRLHGLSLAFVADLADRFLPAQPIATSGGEDDAHA
jgi:hypothetical protein